MTRNSFLVLGLALALSTACVHKHGANSNCDSGDCGDTTEAAAAVVEEVVEEAAEEVVEEAAASECAHDGECTSECHADDAPAAPECDKSEGECDKAEGECDKSEGECDKSEGECDKAEGECDKSEGSQNDDAPVTEEAAAE